MGSELLTSAEAASRLGISVLSLYDWLARSRRGEFQLRGRPFTIQYSQGGARGQGRIRIAVTEIERIVEAMSVQSAPRRQRRLPVKKLRYPGITVPLGRPVD